VSFNNKNMDTQVYDNRVLPNGITLDENGDIVGARPIQDGFDELDRRLVAHFGEDFRRKLNESRTERGMLPL
jgi:hypothetical protein